MRDIVTHGRQAVSTITGCISGASRRATSRAHKAYNMRDLAREPPKSSESPIRKPIELPRNAKPFLRSAVPHRNLREKKITQAPNMAAVEIIVGEFNNALG